MIFSIYNNVRAAHPYLCTYTMWQEVTDRREVREICSAIASEQDHERQGELKKRLPVITWQASFEGARKAAEAKPSGLFMLDIDGIDNPFKLWSSIIGRKDNLGIVLAHKTPSCHGLRLVAKCRPEFATLEECQRWLAAQTGVGYDEVCKDWARASFAVPSEYYYYYDAKAIWEDNPDGRVIYKVADRPPVREKPHPSSQTHHAEPDQREGLFGGVDEYKGIALSKIAREWLEATGGEPERGVRNTRLDKLALRMRYLVDFNEANLLRIMPSYGLGDNEMRQLCHSAVNANRASDMPRDMSDVIGGILRRQHLGETDTADKEIINLAPLPPMPPVIREYVDCAPDDFKTAVAICQLPILGTLASRLRARYLDGSLHSPSFLVCLEAPQASGKSFMVKMANEELASIIEHDEAQRQREREYDAKVKELKLLNTKVNKSNKDVVLGSRPESIIRFVPATMSITKLLMRSCAAKGLHLFAVAEEIDTVTKTFKRSFSGYSDLLRVAFDNGLYGQDYASENSFSGIIPIYYNFLASGTPKAMRRFFPDVEDGTISRACFVTLPDQFGKPMPVWKEFNKRQRRMVDMNLVRLSEVSIIGDEVQPVHEMRLDWLNKELEEWILTQQRAAVKENDRTRDIFCRRAAVVGFRAGMLAWFLYGEKGVTNIRKNVVRFACWVASCMLAQHMLRFEISTTSSNLNLWPELYGKLGDTFTRSELEREITAMSINTRSSQILFKWRTFGLIRAEGVKESKSGRATYNTFIKIKNKN